MSLNHIFLQVRPGFEEDAAQELAHHIHRIAGIDIRPTVDDLCGYVVASIPGEHWKKVRTQLAWRDLIFTRQLLWSTGAIELPNEGDRVTGLMTAVLEQLLPLSEGNAFSGFNFETPDTDDAKELSGFCKSLTRPLENALNKAKLLPKGKGAAHLPRLCVVMTCASTVWPAFADVTNSSPWPMGIPRLKFPPSAPSRSTLKLEEAFIAFLGYAGMEERLKGGMTAVDLGACPGGWTYQLVKHGLHVVAIDNGMIDKALMDSGLVEHRREDAFRYRPGIPVDWLVCDVVEQPARIADLMADWLASGWCTEAIFNLKLPMKQRWQETFQCLEHLKSACNNANVKLFIQCKQLYHDRKEVTVHARRLTN